MRDPIGSILLFFVALLFVAAFVYIPWGVHVHAACLEAGYPRSEVAWNLKGYCLNLEGAVRGEVSRLEVLEP